MLRRNRAASAPMAGALHAGRPRALDEAKVAVNPMSDNRYYVKSHRERSRNHFHRSCRRYPEDPAIKSGQLPPIPHRQRNQICISDLLVPG
jgi:hypothetical protein